MKSRLFALLLLLLGISSFAVAGYLLAQGDYVVYRSGQPIATVSGHFGSVQEVLTAVNVTLRPEDTVRPSLHQAPHKQIFIEPAQTVTVRTPSQTHTYFSQQATIALFLAEIGHPIDPNQPIFADGIQLTPDDLATRPLPQLLEMGKFVTVTVQDGRQQQIRRTAVATVADLLQEAGIQLRPIDRVEPPLQTPLTPNLTVQVWRAFDVTIQVDGRTISSQTSHTTPRQLLAQNGIILVGHDYTIPSLDTPLQAVDHIQVIRVTEDFRTQDQEMPYQTVYQADDQLPIDTQAVVTAGVPGLVRQRIRVRYENGVAVSETVDGEWVAREPVNAVIGYGTQITIQTLTTPDGQQLNYWRVVKMRVTSYTAASSGKPIDAPDYGITASGYPAQQGVVAVDRSIVPWRSWVYVPHYGIGYVGDTGGGVRGRWIDLGYEEDKFVPWSGYTEVYYLTPVPPLEDINFLLPEVLP